MEAVCESGMENVYRILQKKVIYLAILHGLAVFLFILKNELRKILLLILQIS